MCVSYQSGYGNAQVCFALSEFVAPFVTQLEHVCDYVHELQLSKFLQK